jgi:hypothetical protein
VFDVLCLMFRADNLVRFSPQRGDVSKPRVASTLGLRHNKNINRNAVASEPLSGFGFFIPVAPRLKQPWALAGDRFAVTGQMTTDQ